MGVRDRQKQPDIALVVVIDQSGSMAACHCNTFEGGMGGGSGIGGVQKVDIGKEAILRAAAALTERDELGVVGFNEAAHWVVRTQPLGGITDLQGQIAGIRADGQTNIYAGLDQAVQSLEGMTATRRHIILLTDGWSTSGQYDAILAKMKAAGITLSTVGAGGGSNPFLENLAKQGGGRFYAATNPSSIPDIFLKETQQVSGQQIVEETFFPIQTSSSPILRGLDAGLPQLRGYNGTTIKPAAQNVLVTARDDPLLAQWQYGLGRSVAWTSDSTGRWAKDWVGVERVQPVLQPARQLDVPGRGDRRHRGDLRDDRRTDRAPRRERRDRTARRATSTPRAPCSSGRTSSRGRSTSSRSRPASTRRRSARSSPGAYAVRVTQTRPGSSPLGRTVGMVAQTAAEYRQLGANEPFLASLRAATGGTVIATALDPWTHDLTATDRFTDAVAAAAGPRAPALAARHRPAPDVARTARGRGRARLGHRVRAAATGGRAAHRDRRGHAGGQRPGADERGARRPIRERPRAARRDSRARPRHASRRSGRGGVGRHAQVRASPRCPSAAAARTPDVDRCRGRRRPTPAATPPPADAPDTMARLRDAKRRARER